MAVKDSFKRLFGKKKTLATVSMDELRRERIRLEQEERRYTRRVDEVEEEKKSLFMKGKDESSRRRQVIAARKIKEKEAEAKNAERNLQLFSRQLRILNGFIQLKENERILKQSGISNLISTVDLQELQMYVDDATIDGVFHMDKFSDILHTLERSGEAGAMTEDAEVADLVKAMQAAREAEELDPEAPERVYEEQVSKPDVEELEEDF